MSEKCREREKQELLDCINALKAVLDEMCSPDRKHEEDLEIIELSQQLDQLIAVYMKLK